MRRRCVLQHWFDRVDGAMALLAPMVRDEAPRVRLEAVRAVSFVPTPAAAEAALGVLAKPMDYYPQCVLDSTMTTLEPVEAAAHERCVVRRGQPGRPTVLERPELRELASVKRSDPVYEALLTRSGIDRRCGATRSMSSRRAGVSVGTALLAAVSRVAATPGAAATADLMRLLADLPWRIWRAASGAGEPGPHRRAGHGATGRAPRAAARRIGRRGLAADRRVGAAADDLLRAAAAAPEGPAVDSLRCRAAVAPRRRRHWRRGPAAAADDRPLRPASCARAGQPC